jgi:hypothetical protein
MLEVVSANVALGWNMWVAAMTTDQDLRTKLISGIYNQSQFSGASAEVFFGGSPGSVLSDSHSSSAN